jgi:hypothetical protein
VITNTLEKIKNLFQFKVERRSLFVLYLLFIALILALSIPFRYVFLLAFILKIKKGKQERSKIIFKNLTISHETVLYILKKFFSKDHTFALT